MEEKMLYNNQFTADKDDERLERLLALSANIDDHSADLGLIAPDPMLTWAQNAGAEWESAVSSAIIEDGQMDEAFETYANKVSEVYDYYTQARSLLNSYITETENPNDLSKTYGFEGDSPRTGKGLVIAISAWKDQHDHMVAEGLTPVIADPIMTKLLDYENELKDFLNITKIEKDESRQAYKDKAALFATDSRKLRILYNTACLIFGDDDDRLGLLGFVPSSEIWTPGDPIPGLPDFPSISKTFSLSLSRPDEVQIEYSGVNGATHINLSKRLQGEIEWKHIIDLPVDPDEIFPHRDRPGKPGIWEYRITVFNGEEEGESKVATIEVPE